MEQIRTAMDLSEVGLEDAVEQLGGFTPPHVIVCDADKYLAQRLLARIGWSWEIDTELPVDAWKVRLNGKTVYSPGA